MAPTGQHMKNLVRDLSWKILDDKFPPRPEPEDGIVVATQTFRHISYYCTTKVFIKRQPHKDELGLDIYGDPVVAPYVADRLRNEAAVLQFIANNTTIPVPKCRERPRTSQNGSRGDWRGAGNYRRDATPYCS